MEKNIKKQVVFLEPFSSVIIYKIAKLLREKGYETVLIRLLEQNIEDNEFYNKAFNKVININMPHYKLDKKNLAKNILPIIISQMKDVGNYFKSFIEIIKLKPYVYFGKGLSNWPVALFKIIFFRNAPFIYFPYDIRNHLGIENNKNTPFFEFKAERYCFEKADGIMHKGDPEELKPEYMNGRFLGNNLKIQKNKINFHSYCSKEFIAPINNNKPSKKDKELHFAYTGGVKKATDEFFQYLLDYDPFLRQKIHIHFYFCSDTRDKKELEKEKEAYGRFLEKNKNYPYLRYFHFHDSLNPKDLAKEISKYDFGLSGFASYDKTYLESRFATGNKMSTFLEAGLPFFYSDANVFLDRLMKKYGLGLSYSQGSEGSINKIHKILKKIDYKKLQKNVLKAREDFLMEKNINRLIEFIDKVVDNKQVIGNNINFRKFSILFPI